MAQPDRHRPLSCPQNRRPQRRSGFSGAPLYRTESAHTGAIYIEIGGRPIRTSVESAEYFIRYTDELIRQIRLDGFALEDTPADVVKSERAEGIRVFSPAKSIFQQILKEIRDRQM